VKELGYLLIGAYVLYSYSPTFRHEIDHLFATNTHAAPSPGLYGPGGEFAPHEFGAEAQGGDGIDPPGTYKGPNGGLRLKFGYHWVHPGDNSDISTYYDVGSYADGKLKPGCRWVNSDAHDYHTICSSPTYVPPSYNLPSTTTTRTTTNTKIWIGPNNASPPGCGGLDAAHC
jgi:hypothetical protein